MTSDPGSHETRLVRVLIADDDPLARSAIATILRGAPGLELVGECGDGSEVLAAVRQSRPDVVLLDVRMPRVDGVDAVRLLAGLPHPPRALMMTAWDDEGKVLEAIAAGAAGFLLKDEEPAAIVRAVRDVSSGEAAFSARTAGHLRRWAADAANDPARRRARELVGLLTSREREVAFALVSGASDSEIAAELHVAASTIKSTLGAVHVKWGTRNRTQVAVVVARSGLV